MILVVFNDSETYQTEEVEDEILQGREDGLLQMFKMQDGCYYELVDSGEWKLVQEED